MEPLLHETLRARTPVPHKLLHWPQSDVNHAHPEKVWHFCVVAGPLPGQSSGLPDEHDTFLFCTPMPQELLQVDHTEYCHEQPSVA